MEEKTKQSGGNMHVYMLMTVIYAGLLSLSYQQSCIEFNIPRDHRGKQLLEAKFETSLDNTLVDCARKCFYASACKSFNFRKWMGLCQLNNLNSSQVDDTRWNVDSDFTFSDKTDWPKEIAGPCSESPCTVFEKCMPLKPYRCHAWCPDPPYVENAEYEWGEHAVGSVRIYYCLEGFLMSSSSNTVSCQANSTWSPVRFQCDVIRSCSELKLCNPGYSDGEYWLFFPAISTTRRLKIFCAEMMTSYPIEFITLATQNTVTYVTDRQIHTENYLKLHVQTTDLQILGFLRSGTSSCLTEYGVISLLDEACSVTSYTMWLSTKSTGFAFGQTPQWLLGTDSKILQFFETFEDADQKHILTQGELIHDVGTVMPVPGLHLKIDYTEDLPLTDATVPVCV